jgi:hypothetical protein
MAELAYHIDFAWGDLRGVYLMGWAHLHEQHVLGGKLQCGDREAPLVFSPRPDVSAAFPQLPAKQPLGFKVYLSCPAFRPVTLHIFGESEAVVVDLQIGTDVGPIAAPEFVREPPFDIFVAAMKEMGGTVLEIGARTVAPGAVLNASKFMPQCTFLGADIYQAPGVDIVVDAHVLGSKIEAGSLTGIFSLAVMEHIAAPWVVAAEINRALRIGGMTFHVVPHAFPAHEQPNDFWRTSDDGLKILFGPATGFEIVQSGMASPVQIVPPEALRDGPFVEMPFFHAYASAYIFAKKVADLPDGAVKWPLDEILSRSQSYPSHQ